MVDLAAVLLSKTSGKEEKEKNIILKVKDKGRANTLVAQVERTCVFLAHNEMVSVNTPCTPVRHCVQVWILG